MTHKNGLEKPHVIKVVDNPTPEIWARTDKDRKIKNHIRQIEALLGHPITITPKAA